MLEKIAGDADRLVVVDTETTGVFNSDRIVEIALVTMALDGQVIDEYETLVDPNRDVGPTHIHRITAEMVAGAPAFADIAGDVAIRLDGACVVAHNLPFDLRMARNEYQRLGLDVEVPAGVDTLRASGMSLAESCSAQGIALDGHHRALTDARATASLLQRLAADCEIGGRAAAPVSAGRSGVVRRRSGLVTTHLPDPPLIVYLASRLGLGRMEAQTLQYLELVGRAVSDLHLDRGERAALSELAAELGLEPARVALAHRRYLNTLIDAALDDHIVTDDEYEALIRIARALEIDQDVVENRTRSLRSAAVDVPLSEGMSVVFTGEASVPRADLMAHASTLGLVPQKNVTKKTDLLVAADPESASGKAAKARQYGVPVVAAADFGQLQLGYRLSGSVVESAKVIECPDCFTTWIEPATSGAHLSRRCKDCASVPSEAKPAGGSTLPPPPPPPR